MKSCAFLLAPAIVLLCVLLRADVQPTNKETADRIVIDKAVRKLTLFSGIDTIRTYSVALGGQPAGPKQCRGDKRTPEGQYNIDSRNSKSRYHRSLHISYPNAADQEAAREQGCNPGGDIMIHGLPNWLAWTGKSHSSFDWTLGCIAVTNEEIEEIWDLVPDGIPVEINP